MRIQHFALSLLIVFANTALTESISATPNTGLMSSIVGGSISPQNAYPFLISLEYDSLHHCSAFLISSRLLMTAAHCVASESTPDIQLFKAVFGRHDLSLEKADEGAFEVGIKEIYIHDSFDFETLVYDIAICELESPISDFRPAPLDMKGKYSESSTLVTAVGWGSFYDSESQRLQVSDVVREVELSILKPSVCQDFFGSLDNAGKYPFYPEIMQCMGPANSRSGSCNGDSGGPVFATTPSGQSIVVGIISWGLPNGCGLERDPSVNTPIYEMRDWIATIAKLVRNQQPQAATIAPSTPSTGQDHSITLPRVESPGASIKAKKSNSTKHSITVLLFICVLSCI